MTDRFDDADLAAAAALDTEIDGALGGGPSPASDPVVLWLTATVRSDPPAALGARVRAEHARREHRRWRPARIAAAALAALFLGQGVGSLVNGAWVARNLGEDYSPHAFTEGGLALLAVGIAIAAGVFRRSWLPISVAAGVPLGLAFGVLGFAEVGEFAAGAVLHLSEGAAAGLLGLAWWRARRYDRGRPGEDEA
jgi:hypothetical protein